MVNLSRKQFIIIGAIVAVVVGALLFFLLNLRQSRFGSGEKVSLSVVGIDPPEAWTGIIASYNILAPNVTINYESSDQASYKDKLLNSLASGRGPDIFYIGNHDLLSESNKIVPVSQAALDLPRLRELFPAVVERDFVFKGKIGALPLYIDTLATIYNRDIFDQAGVAVPPKTWDEFLRILPQLRQFGSGGQVSRAAAAIGGTEKSVNAGVDLLNLLMLQNGARMNDAENKTALFASGESGPKAFDFYLQFANAASPNFTWSDGMGDSVSAFASGKTAIIFNYLSSAQAAKNINTFLDVGVSPMLQPSGASSDINYANYHGLAVSSQSRAQSWAWDFVLFAATNPSSGASYSRATGRPPALRTLITENTNDPDLGVFARQALTARSWFQPSASRVKDIFNSAIMDVLTGRTNSSNALRQAEGQISDLYPEQ